MSGLVVGAAPAPGRDVYYRDLLRTADHIVAADAAGEWCLALGSVPDAVVGDFDSAAEGAIDRLTAAGSEIVRVPAAKDETDLELAVRVALARFEGPLTITCAFSARMDHTLAAFGALLAAGPGAMAREPQWTAWLASPGSPLSLSLEPGLRFSVIGVAGAAGVSVSGGRWTLEQADLAPLSGRGLSNIVEGGRVEVSCGEGTVLVMVCDQP